MDKISVHTAAGWVDIDEDDIDSHGCNNCPEPAEIIVDGGAGDIFWAQCLDCAPETRAESDAANAWARTECED